METMSETTTDNLRDLIIINNDRYEGYQKAMEQTEDADLNTLFSKFSSQSKTYAAELRTLIPSTEDEPERDETRLSGKFYRVWMDVKNALSTADRKAVLSSCEYGEDVAKKAYQNALEDREAMSPSSVTLIQNQYDQLLAAHDTVKALRDSAK